MRDARLVIIDRVGEVHRMSSDDAVCSKVAPKPIRAPTTVNQCLAYKLRPCKLCWPKITNFERMVHRVTTS